MLWRRVGNDVLDLYRAVTTFLDIILSLLFKVL